MDKANQRMKVIQHDLKKIQKAKQDESDSDDEDIDDTEGLKAELAELEKAHKARQDKLDEYEKNKKWHIDNMFTVKEERTIVNPKAAETDFTQTGFVQPKEEAKPKKQKPTADVVQVVHTDPSKETKKAAPVNKATTTVKEVTTAMSQNTIQPASHSPDVGVMDTYPEFTDKYADKVEEFMAIPDLEGSKQFLLQNASILLQENASNYLLLASLEDEMNGHRDKMKRTARQSQIISNIAELAKTMKTHPGNVIMPFFQRLQQREHLETFVEAVNDFSDKIIRRAVVKKKELDAARAEEDKGQPTALEDIPREERLGPGGLDPVEVIKTLPKEMVEAFESRDVQQLQDVLMKMEPGVAEKYMKDCVDSGLWVANN